MFYVYAFLRDDGTPYYIGKGKGNRKDWKYGRVVKPPQDKSKIILLKDNLTESESFKWEVYYIHIYGRKDNGTGLLRNLTDGGDGISGYVFTEEQKKHLSNSHKGKVLTEEHKNNISKSAKNTPHKPHTQETKDKITESLIGNTRRKDGKRTWKPDEEYKKKMSKALKGKKKPPMSEEHRRKLSQAKMGNKNRLGGKKYTGD